MIRLHRRLLALCAAAALVAFVGCGKSEPTNNNPSPPAGNSKGGPPPNISGGGPGAPGGTGTPAKP